MVTPLVENGKENKPDTKKPGLVSKGFKKKPNDDTNHAFDQLLVRFSVHFMTALILARTTSKSHQHSVQNLQEWTIPSRQPCSSHLKA